MPVEDAISSIFSELYQIKSQTQVKIKIPGLGFEGSLMETCPGRGYKVQMDLPGTLIYPNP
jgi:hypothetical protein